MQTPAARVDQGTSAVRPFFHVRAAVFAFALCMALLQADRMLAQGDTQPLPCPSLAPGTPEPEWFKGAMRAGRGMPNPTLVKSAKPTYPPEALKAKVTGVVAFDARVDVDGRIRNLCLVQSEPLLNAEAAKAAKAFEFRPAQQNGAPIPAIIRLEIAFNLREKL